MIPQWVLDHQIINADAAQTLKRLADDGMRFDAAVFSPPYENARQYGEVDFKLAGISFVQWLAGICRQLAAMTDGPCCCVINGRTQKFEWSGVPFLLWTELKYPGMVCGDSQFLATGKRSDPLKMRKPLIFHRRGIMGSGGPDYFRDDYELVIVFGRKRRYTNADPLAQAKPPKYPPGGAPSHRKPDGTRVVRKEYKPPKLANPGNVISGSVGKGHMGDDLAHKSEAPYPEWLASRLVTWGCPRGGVVCDPFAGSGTTMAVAMKNGRKSFNIELREDQVEVIELRREQVAKAMESLAAIEKKASE